MTGLGVLYEQNWIRRAQRLTSLVVGCLQVSFLNNVGTALRVGRGVVTVVIAGKSTFEGNTGQEGGAVQLSDGGPTLGLAGDATFIRNNADANGGELPRTWTVDYA
jgi:hypothetical protein